MKFKDTNKWLSKCIQTNVL